MNAVNENPYSAVQILLVEDDDIDAEAIGRAFRKAKIANPTHRVCDGMEALEVLRGNAASAISHPYLVLLDLNLPRLDGIGFLREIRADGSLKGTIVFVLTTSDDDADKIAAYDEQIAGYMVKSRAGKDFMNLINMLDHYWRVVEFPPEKLDGT
ncbi:response regulator [Crateriforma spongiae]|uniref:response regulator n=1 Tax=Crateriforma spongiae TaxID=2724528 RepID=UPI00144695D7|nr:response regulator [Crateriforma spongiae]